MRYWENRFYRVRTLDAGSGSIRGIWDKDLKRELVDASSPYRFGSYVYVTGADDMPDNQPLPVWRGAPKAAFDDASGHRRAHSCCATRGGKSESAILESSAPNTPWIRTVITFLPADAKRIDIRVSLRKIATLHREAAYIAFPLAVEYPEFAYDTQNGWVNPARDELAGGSRGVVCRAALGSST